MISFLRFFLSSLGIVSFLTLFWSKASCPMASSSKSLENACASLTLVEEEEDGLIFGNEDIRDSDEEYKLALVGRLTTDRPIKFNVMRDTMAAVWRPGKGMKATEIAANLFIFQFFHEVDIKHILEDGQWAFEQNLLVLKRFDPKFSPFDVPLNMAEFWIQAHNLPRSFFTEKVVQAIGEFLGTYVRADKRNFEGSWKSFLRIRVLLDISKPLRRKMKMKKQGGDWFWVEFKYERLPNFCFICGIIGHTERFCHRLFEGADEETERPYGAWLRASGRRLPVHSGNQWIISDDPQRPVTYLTTNQEVEKVEAETRTQVRYEEQNIHSTLETRGQCINPLEVCDVLEDSDKKVIDEATNMMSCEAQIIIGQRVGSSEMDQKRKRVDYCESKIVLMEEDVQCVRGSKNVQEAGHAVHARLHQ